LGESRKRPELTQKSNWKSKPCLGGEGRKRRKSVVGIHPTGKRGLASSQGIVGGEALRNRDSYRGEGRGSAV